MQYQPASLPKRQYRQGANRDQGQLLPASVEDHEPDNPARVIDAFVDSLDLEKAGFTKSKPRKKELKEARLMIRPTC